MGFHKEQYTVDCPSCGTTNFVVIGYAGYGPANERERTHCYKCKTEVASEKCGWIHSASSYEDADLSNK